MELKKLDLTNAYQAIPKTFIADIQVWSSYLNTWAVTLALSATPWADDVAILWPSQWVTLYEKDSDATKVYTKSTKVYAKSSVASWDVLYMIKS
jgi:hypothetical protein